ncbi:MAG: hypothetical protein RLZZ299_2359 [Pseudomonadota bacterium]|jgi:uncharacterized membrane protein YeaQ/YmgE (transglycosylase-associated protein family)
MDWIVAILVGAFVGWLASVIMRTRSEQGPLLDVVVGIVGAALGRGVFGTLLGIDSASSAGTFSVVGVAWGLLGAVLLVALLRALNVFRPA